MVVATFILPPLLALILANVFRLTLGELAGLFMVGATPGVPLLTRNLARRGFDMHMAASYQVWAALLVPVMIPFVVAAAARLDNREVWISPVVLPYQIATKQLVPFAVGMVIAWATPKLSRRCPPTINMLGNTLLTILIALVLFKIGGAPKQITPLLPIATLLLAVGSMAAVWVVRLSDSLARQTFAVCKANRHAGLAQLLSGQHLHATRALPAIACYALAAPAVMLAYARWDRAHVERVD